MHLKESSIMSYTIHNSLVTCFGHFVDIYLFGGYIFFASIASWSSRCGVWVSLTSINLNKALSIEGLILKRFMCTSMVCAQLTKTQQNFCSIVWFWVLSNFSKDIKKICVFFKKPSTATSRPSCPTSCFNRFNDLFLYLSWDSFHL